MKHSPTGHYLTYFVHVELSVAASADPSREHSARRDPGSGPEGPTQGKGLWPDQMDMVYGPYLIVHLVLKVSVPKTKWGLCLNG